MRTFYKKVVLFVILLGILCVAVEILSLDGFGRSIVAEYTDSEEYIAENVGAAEIMPYIEKVRKKDQTTILILGDSVCNQMLDPLQPLNEAVCIAGTNSAISLTGQYILAKEYVTNHANVSDIYLFFRPDSLNVTFTTTWGYQYAIMPFAETDTLSLLDADTIEKMKAVYGGFFMKKSIAGMIDRSAINRKIYLNMLKRYSTEYTQSYGYEIADRYVEKIYDLCKENGIQLHMLPCPVAESERNSVELKKSAYENSWLYTIFPDFLENVLYVEDEEFGDGVHFGGEYATSERYNEKLKIIFGDTNLMDVLKFE